MRREPPPRLDQLEWRSKRSELPPEDCPTPTYHEMFHYCPSCSWTNPDAPTDPASRLRSAINQALKELGEANESYPAPVANAIDILKRAVA